MIKLRWMFLLVAVGVLASVQTTQAFNGSRKGFILGAGLGLGVDSYTQEISDGLDTVKSDRQNDFSLASDFKIGIGLSEQALLYFHNQAAWFGIDNIAGDSVTIESGVVGVGFTWFTSPEARGLFLTGTAGVAYWNTPFESDSESWTSVGAIGGVGYEFSPHWSVDASVLLGAPEKTEGGITGKTNSASFLVTVTGLAY